MPKNVRTDSESARRAEEAQASLRAGIARARKLAAESKRLLDRLSYGRLGPRGDRLAGAVRLPANERV